MQEGTQTQYGRRYNEQDREQDIVQLKPRQHRQIRGQVSSASSRLCAYQSNKPHCPLPGLTRGLVVNFDSI